MFQIKQYHTHMKKYLVLTLVSICMLAAACRKQTFEERIAQEVEEYNSKNGVRNIDECTTLDSMSFDIATLTISYHHTLFGQADDKEIITDEIKELHRESLLKDVRGSIAMREYKDYGCNFRYVYNSKSSGEVLLEEIVTPEDYK